VRTDDGVLLHVETEGPPDAPLTVVFSHGFAARGALFDPQWADLRGECRLVRYDQRGHGDSGWSGARAATMERLGRDLGQIVDAQGGQGRVVLVGHSMGGMAVLALAGLRPELFGNRIAGVALLSTRAAPLTAGESSAGAALRIRTALGIVGASVLWVTAPLLQAVHPFRSLIGHVVLRRRLFAEDPPDQPARAARSMWVDTPAAVMSAYLRALSTYDARAAVGALRQVAVLVLSGEEDSTIPVRSSRWLADRIGGHTRLVLVPGAGHMVTMTHSAEADAALRDLLTESVPGAGGRRAT
jgi:pimeloyl-ACP methyl ester carboxylesterase